MAPVSIVIPCRNGAAYIGATIRSALNQTLAPAEIIVIDDGSTDDSREIAANFGPKVRVHAGAAQGAAIARNTGAALAGGQRLMFVDADDLLTPDTLAALSAALDDAPMQALAICPWDRLEVGGDPNDPFAPWLVGPPSNDLPRPGQDALAAWLTGTWSPPCCVLWTRAGFEASGGWLQGLDDDGNLMRRALARGIARRWAPDGLALYRRLPGDMVSYSGRRLEPAKLRERRNALADTVAELETAGLLARYRAPLMETLAALYRDAAPQHEWASDLDALATRIGGSRRWDAPLSRLARFGARAAAWLAERRTAVTLAKRAAIAPEPAGLTSAQPLVSVIIPTYNRAEQVQRAIDSVLAQRYDNVELIVVDDGSTDETVTTLNTLVAPCLRVISQANGGVSRARNRGLAAARGDYIALLDSDDTWNPDKLMRQVAVMEAAAPVVGFCYTGTDVRIAGERVQIHRPRIAGLCLTGLLLTNPGLSAGSGSLVRREVFDATGGFDPDMPALEDWEWLQRVARLYAFCAVDAPLTVYNDQQTEARRSRDFRQNMSARAMLWARNRHALRRIGVASIYLLESARRELREAEGDPARGRALVRSALWERPQNWRAWPWLAYMLAPFSVRAWLRDRDALAHARRRARQSAEIRPD